MFYIDHINFGLDLPSLFSHKIGYYIHFRRSKSWIEVVGTLQDNEDGFREGVGKEVNVFHLIFTILH